MASEFFTSTEMVAAAPSHLSEVPALPKMTPGRGDDFRYDVSVPAYSQELHSRAKTCIRSFPFLLTSSI
jgi:hypothetical protein